MKFIDKKGFILIETLIVAVFVTSIFIMIFTNALPIMAEYQRIEHYDDLDGKYAAHYIRRLIITDSNWSSIMTISGTYKVINCAAFNQSEECEDLVNSLRITNMYLTDFKTSGEIGKIKVSIPSEFDKELKDYIKYMVSISTVPDNYTTLYTFGKAKRIIIVRTDEDNNETYYSNIEVVKP